MRNDTEPVLDVEDLTVVTNGGNTIIEGLSLSVNPATMTAVVGESGAGKSMTTKAILGLLDDHRFSVTGRVALCGTELLTLSTRERRRYVASCASLVFQNATRALNPTMRVGKQIAESILHGPQRGTMSKAEAHAHGISLMRQVGIADPEERYFSYPYQLSGGMRQRVVIAIALSAQPKVMFCDEPTSSLDVTTQALIMDLLDTLRGELGISIVLITHDLPLAESRADDVLVMYGGRLVESLPVADLSTASAMPYTRALLASVPGTNDADIQWDRIPAKVRTMGPRDGCMYHPTCLYTQAKCAEEVPPLTRLSPDHQCRCWFPVGTASAVPAVRPAQEAGAGNGR